MSKEITEENLIELQACCFDFSSTMISQYEEPLAVSAALLNTAMSIYRTVLSEDDYQKICKMIYETRSKVKAFTAPKELLN